MDKDENISDSTHELNPTDPKEPLPNEPEAPGNSDKVIPPAEGATHDDQGQPEPSPAVQTQPEPSAPVRPDSVGHPPPSQTGPAPPPSKPTEIPTVTLNEPNRSGVLIKDEIKSRQLIRLPDGRHECEDCYKPASYDLRLGSEYVMPRKDTFLEISSCDVNGMLSIEPFGTVIVSTYEHVSLPNNVVARFNLRIDHALEGLIVQMGTQVEPDYEGPLFALLHNISGQRKSLKYGDYETRPFTIEFSYTSQPLPPREKEKAEKKVMSLREFIPPNYAREGVNSVLRDIRKVQKRMDDVSREVSTRKMMWFTGIFFALIILTAGLFIPLMLSKFSFDRSYYPLVNADAIAAKKYAPSNDEEIVKRVLQQLNEKSSNSLLVPRDQFFEERLAQLKARRDAIKNDPTRTAELKSVQSQINEIIELLKK